MIKTKNMGNTIDSVCCGCLLPNNYVNDYVNTNTCLIQTKEPKSIYTIYEPLDYNLDTKVDITAMSKKDSQEILISKDFNHNKNEIINNGTVTNSETYVDKKLNLFSEILINFNLKKIYYEYLNIIHRTIKTNKRNTAKKSKCNFITKINDVKETKIIRYTLNPVCEFFLKITDLNFL